MPEVTIQYKSPKTLNLLKDLSKYMDFVISEPMETINGVPFIRGTSNIDKPDLTGIFKNVDAKKLRKQAWQREK